MPRVAKPLTAIEIRRLAEPGLHAVGTVSGLRLRLTPIGARHWVRCSDKQLWRRIAFHVEQVRALESFTGVCLVGLDETSLRRGQDDITVVHDLEARRLLFATEGRDHQTMAEFAADGMVDRRSNAFVEAINRLLQQAKRAARGFRSSRNFIAIAYLRMSKLRHLPVSPLAPAAAGCARCVPHPTT